MNVALERLIESPPKFHGASHRLRSYGVSPTLVKLISDMVASDHLTLETGGGVSTVVFAILGTEHICVSPAFEEHERIRAYCQEHDISIGRVRFVLQRSEVFLPSLDIGGRRLDFALIDGEHAFPMPIIDYFFINNLLGIGGILAVDDLQIPSVNLLHKFLITDPAYKVIGVDSERAGIYRKVAEMAYPSGWMSQPMNRTLDFSFLPARPNLRIWVRRMARRVPLVAETYRMMKRIVRR